MLDGGGKDGGSVFSWAREVDRPPVMTRLPLGIHLVVEILTLA